MRMNKYGRELELLVLLSDNGNYTALQLAERLGITRRNLYYYFDYLRACGFKLIKNGTTYRLDRNTSFFRRLHENISLSVAEAEYIVRLFDSTGKNDLTASSIRTKLMRTYSLMDILSPEVQKLVDHNVSKLKEAIARKLMVRLCGYSSPHSSTVADRIVEPFALMSNSTEVRCHEIKSHQNKTFKLSRMSDVEILDVPWIHEAEHKDVYTDVFMFCGDERHRVQLSLGQLSHNLLVEEFPGAGAYVAPIGDRWLFTADVVSFHAVGRFVLGLYSDIQVLGSDEFVSYISAKVSAMHLPSV